jgi:hypothetical protein
MMKKIEFERALWFVLITKYCRDDETKEAAMDVACGTQLREQKGTYGLCGKTEGKRGLGGSTRRYGDNIKMDIKEI